MAIFHNREKEERNNIHKEIQSNALYLFKPMELNGHMFLKDQKWTAHFIKIYMIFYCLVISQHLYLHNITYSLSKIESLGCNVPHR